MKKEKKNIIIAILIVIVIVSFLAGAIFIAINKNNDYKTNDDYECCEGCECGNTLEMLKNIETAWTLAEINSKGEYDYSRCSFINFHGTGKNKFAFFKNDDDCNDISEVRGDFKINGRGEIILMPNDNKNNIITCKLGKEKDLMAIMECDKNFGIFMLQKTGKLELPDIILDTLPQTKSIIVKTYQLLDAQEDKSGYKEVKTITDEKDINSILSVIGNAKVWTGAVTLPMPKYELELLDISDKSLAIIHYRPNFSIEIKDKKYSLVDLDYKALDSVLEK